MPSARWHAYQCGSSEFGSSNHARRWPRLYHVRRGRGDALLDRGFDLAHDEKPLVVERLHVVLVQLEDTRATSFSMVSGAQPATNHVRPSVVAYNGLGRSRGRGDRRRGEEVGPPLSLRATIVCHTYEMSSDALERTAARPWRS